MKPLWVIQDTCLNDEDSKGMTDALEGLHVPYQRLRVPPFSLQIPDVYHDGPIIPYGGTKFIDRVNKIKNWHCWFNDNFLYSLALQHYQKNMFNHDATCMKIRDFCPSSFEDELLFIRPNKDLKEFAGDVFTKTEFINWVTTIDKQGYDVNENTDILVASPSRIDYEWRVFLVNGIAVSASQYRKNHFLKPSSGVPQAVIEFAERMYLIWHPAKVFVMDICQVNDDLAILEIGDFHSAGWYHSDKLAIMFAVSEFAVKENYAVVSD